MKASQNQHLMTRGSQSLHLLNVFHFHNGIVIMPAFGIES